MIISVQLDCEVFNFKGIEVFNGCEINLQQIFTLFFIAKTLTNFIMKMAEFKNFPDVKSDNTKSSGD